MDRRSKRNIRLKNADEVAIIKAEREKCLKMVEHFDRKGLTDTYWHKTLVRLDKALEQYKGVKENGEHVG